MMFNKYLRQHTKTFAMFILFILLFLIIFFLYDCPLEPVLYGFLLCLFLGSISMIYDYVNFSHRHRMLCDLRHRILIDLDELPVSKYLIEQDYIELIHILDDDKKKKLSNADGKQQELLEYMTLWTHQIKTPIAAMRLLLENTAQDPELDIELFRIEQYVEMVLSYLKMDTNDYVIRKVNLDDCIRQSIRKYARLFIMKKLTIDYNTIHYQALSDEKWLGFVIEQLLSNAIKYTKQGGIHIYMEQDCLVISDSGIGIKAEDLPLVFDKGYTGYNGHADKQSTGIGLYLCKIICTRLGHRIWLESEVGKGTKVYLDLHRQARDVRD